MRALSISQASRCETAKTPTCRCRCAGALHGKARGADDEFFRQLPEEDPHRAGLKRKRKRRAKPPAPLPLFD